MEIIDLASLSWYSTPNCRPNIALLAHDSFRTSKFSADLFYTRPICSPTLTTTTSLNRSMPPLSHPRHFPSSVPGGSLIGSVGSQFSTAYTQTLNAKTRHPSQYDPRSPPPTYTSQKPEYTSRHKTRAASCFL